jgi:hypothetical protein
VTGMEEQCYRQGCDGAVTGASDYCSPECETRASQSQVCKRCGNYEDTPGHFFGCGDGA